MMNDIQWNLRTLWFYVSSLQLHFLLNILCLCKSLNIYFSVLNLAITFLFSRLAFILKDWQFQLLELIKGNLLEDPQTIPQKRFKDKFHNSENFGNSDSTG